MRRGFPVPGTTPDILQPLEPQDRPYTLKLQAALKPPPGSEARECGDLAGTSSYK